jgi:23S rRNA (cytosine1962-C5)-methyltransferase
LLLSRLEHTYKTGIDLFSYVGAWGLSALKAGLQEVTFVDQGDFKFEVDEGLMMNDLEGRGSYHRTDVFNFLDNAISGKNTFDVILSDPPAFAKSLLHKNQALDGYSKLHRKIFKLISPGGLIAFSSCTHYVSHNEFQKNIADAAEKEGRVIQLLYSGMQGWDHPIKSLDDRSNYIKSYFYLVE